jgi:large subunit ribosomal protein L6
MSRVGKNPVAIPQGVTVAVAGRVVTVKGKLGELKLETAPEVETGVQDGKFWVKPRNETKRARALWGTTRANVNNMVRGVSQGFQRNLEINGVGYRAAVQGKNLQLQLGYSHDVVYPIPEGITVTVPKPTEITIVGSDPQRVGQVAAEIRSYRPPEPYKGKGVKYAGEFIFRKEGKKK